MKLVTFLLLSVTLPACGPQDSTVPTSLEERHEHQDFDASIRNLYGGYSMIKLNGKATWSMNLKTYPGSIENIDSIAVKPDNILIYSTESYILHDTLRRAAWFILTPRQQSEKQFLTHRDFNEYLGKEHIVNNMHKMVK